MRFINLEQGSQEWLNFRKDKIGASDVPAIMGIDPYCTPYQKWEQKVFGKTVKVNSAMQRGIDLEPIVRDWYSSSFGIVRPAVIQSDQHPYMIASLDGIDEKRKKIVEIKCCKKEYYDLIADGGIPEGYWVQIQYQLLLANDSEYSDDLIASNGKEQVRLEVLPCPKIQEEISDKVKKFYEQNILEFIAPPLCDKDIEARYDSSWNHAKDRWHRASATLKKALEEEEEAKKELIMQCNGRNSEGGGVRVVKVFRRGNVDYSKIPMLKGVDLNPFRKSSTEHWRVT